MYFSLFLPLPMRALTRYFLLPSFHLPYLCTCPVNTFMITHR